MVASPAEIQRSPSAAALDLVTLMQETAEQGEWERAEKIAIQLRRAVLEIPDGDRADIVIAVNRVLERVQTIALTSRVEVLDKLTEIRRGRDAQRAYGQPAANSETAELR